MHSLKFNDPDHEGLKNPWEISLPGAVAYIGTMIRM